MKKVIYLISILFIVALTSTSCEKDDSIVPDLTLEEQYPEWSNLSWVSTDGDDDPNTYPQLNITIDGNLLTVIHEHSAPDPKLNAYFGKYSSMTIVGDVVTFSDSPDPNGVQTVMGIINSNDGVEISLTTKGLSKTSHIFVLKIN